MNYIRQIGVLLCALISTAVGAQTVSGTVTDENNQPLPGATVVVEGTNRGTSTDFDGKYTINAAQGETLSISYVGYATQKVVIAAATHDVMLQSDSSLEEVIVTGYSSQRKSEVTGSAVQLGGERLNTLTVPSVDQALQGNVSGLAISTNSGTPGSTSQIRIRGVSSITAGNEPLYVIDGVPITSGNASSSTTSSFLSSIAGIDANNIESITVLKDASSTAQYGARGSNGVILITTKKGGTAKGLIRKETSFQLNSYYGYQNDATDGPLMLTAAQRFQLYAEGLHNDSPDAYTTIDAAKDHILKNVSSYTAWDTAGRPEANWASVITNKDAPISEHSFSASSSDEKSQLYASLGYMKQEATVIGADFDRITATLNVTKQLNDKVRFNSNNSLSVTDQNGILERSAYFEGPRTVKFFGSPLLEPFTKDGEINKYGGAIPNPLYIAENYINQNKLTRIITNNSLALNVIDGLNFTSRLNIDYQVFHRKSFSDRNYGYGQSNNGELFDAHRNNVTYTIQNFLDYSLDVSENHGIDFKLLQEYQQNKTYFLSAEGYEFPDDGLHYLNSAGSPISVGSSFYDWYVGAYMFSSHYSGFDGKYIADINFRREASSRFGKDNRWGNFWSVGAAWNIHKENFLSDSSFINNLKLRASYGVTGNANIRLNQYQAKFGYDSDYAGEGAVYTSTFGNKNLSWETSSTLDVALEFTLFDAVFDGSFGFYKRTSSDLLLNVPLSLTTGFSSQTKNVGSLENTGIEFDYIFNIIQSEKLNFSVSGNIGTAKNKVVQLAKDGNGEYITITTTTTKVDVNHPVYGWYMPTWAGVNPDTGEEEFFLNGKDGKTTTVFNDAADAWQGGSAIPTLTGGINFNLDYKGFFIDATGYYAGGHKVYEGWHRYVNNNYSGFSVQYYNGFASLLTDAWRQKGDIARNGKITTRTIPWQRHSKYLHDGDFFRLRTLTFGYNFPSKTTSSFGLDRLRLYVRGNNLYTWQKAKDQPYDPEVDLGFVNSDGVVNSGGQTGLETPPVKSIIFGINLNF